MKKIIVKSVMKSSLILSCISGGLVSSQLGLVKSAEAAQKTPIKFSQHMNSNQQLYEVPTVYKMSGFSWSGKAGFLLIVTPVSSSGSTVSVRVDRIIRIWFADELGYWAVRQSDCRKFPCSDEKGKMFPAPSPLPAETGIGSVVVVDKSDLINRSTLTQRENSGSFDYFDDKGYYGL